MSKVEMVEKQVQELSPEELGAFRKWFASFDAEMWDQQLETDILAGKLDSLADRALQDHAAGRSTRL